MSDVTDTDREKSEAIEAVQRMAQGMVDFTDEGSWAAIYDDLAKVEAVLRRPGGALVAPTREALTEIITGLAGHGYNAQMSQNLGFYRTAVVCSCGVELWWGEHEGDPTHREVWGGHLADSLLASGLLGERREAVQAEALEAAADATFRFAYSASTHSPPEYRQAPVLDMGVRKWLRARAANIRNPKRESVGPES